MEDFYNDGQLELQKKFGSRDLADRLEEVTHHNRFSDADKSFIESATFFFLATADRQGRPECSHKGGPPGFVRVLNTELLVFPDYDGNGMFRSLGNMSENPHVGLLFISMNENPKRLRVNGDAVIGLEDTLITTFPGAQAIIRVTPTHIFPNCPRYIHDCRTGTLSQYTPSEGRLAVEPAWKKFDEFKDVVPKRKT
jgi:predicted pyridoxine 5'-phosphate oxidase superfamily flavin-nucleotide-binding protein